MRKKVLTSVIAFSMLFSLSTTIFADPVSDRQQQQDIIDKNNNMINQSKEATESIESKIEALDESISIAEGNIASNKVQISNSKIQIEKVEKDIAAAQTLMNEEQELFDERMRAIYINGNDGAAGYLGVLFESKGMSDFLARIDTVKKLAELDNKILADLKIQQDIVKNTKAVLDKDKAKLEALVKDSETKLAKLTSDRKVQQTFIVQAKSEQSKFEADINRAKALIAQMTAGLPASNNSRGAIPISSNAIVSYAYQFMGRPYVYGANGPATFDCSGYTKYVFAHFGVTLNRVAVDQASQGSSVSRDNLQPGDLVFFGKTMRSIHHVGIYVGEGCYIHAPHTGDVIKVSAMGRSDFICAKRVY
ncbi:MAG: C40 family peptidase [Clostridiaceae bacterium]|nr:C40 family peptidase [Clostridiaceae bacterium]